MTLSDKARASGLCKSVADRAESISEALAGTRVDMGTRECLAQVSQMEEELRQVRALLSRHEL